ncbi:hypothetical protein [Variovorax ginsengisoli]|uniref:Toxin CptA n=1 Tax=Variovorax ginsengisoli TaxID=363844 RepID=A0ABT9S0C5_9BURK|nr:hypothetical protein [Variovorax ginsengisoli]MDP9897803.1 hypothetical protein [Variovorax ginsengisoli]
MHSAPSVSYPVGRSSRNAARLLLGLWWAGACVTALTAWQLQHVGWRTVLLGGSVLLAGWALRHEGRTGRAQGAGMLQFDSNGWSLKGATLLHAECVEVCLDLQSLLLVRLQRAGESSRWLWLDACSEPAHWPDLRRAVYSRAPSTAPDSHAVGPQVARASSTFS